MEYFRKIYCKYKLMQIYMAYCEALKDSCIVFTPSKIFSVSVLLGQQYEYHNNSVSAGIHRVLRC